MKVMKKLSRSWRKSEDDNLSLPTRDDPSLDDSRPIDSREQEELVRSLEKSHAHQSLQWRCVFASLFGCYAAFLVYSTCHQSLYPWELRYHAYFMEDIPSLVVICADWISILACSMVIVGLLHSSKHRRRWIRSSICTGLLIAVFWLFYMMRLPRFRWDVIWLPFGPLSGASISLYVDHLLEESSAEVRKLRSYMYIYKAS